MTDKKTKESFKSRARLLQHLGDQLIGTPRLAVFELVKNSYDADASRVTVEIAGIGTSAPSIVVSDDGTGMSPKVIRDIWLVIAHDHKAKDLREGKRTPKGRLPLGSKGLGRLSVHKLGNKIEIVTKSKGHPEVVVRINWNDLISQEYLEDALFDVETRDPIVFTRGRTGTQINIGELREQFWTRGEIRRLYRQVTSISSPFGSVGRDDFVATLEVPDYPQWIERLPDPEELLKRAPWTFSFRFDGENFDYRYEFKRIPGLQREGRVEMQKGARLLVPPPPKR